MLLVLNNEVKDFYLPKELNTTQHFKNLKYCPCGCTERPLVNRIYYSV